MHKKIREMRKKRKGLIEAAANLRAASDILSAEDMEKMGTMLDEADQLGVQIEADERLMDSEASLLDVANDAVDTAATRGQVGQQNEVAAQVEGELRIVAFLRNSIPEGRRKGMDFSPLAMSWDQRKRLEAAGVSRSDFPGIIEAAQSVGTDAAGGFTVPEMWSAAIQEGADREVGMLRVGVTGVMLDRFGKYHVIDDANEIDSSNAEAEIKAEGVGVTEDTTSFGETVISPYLLHSRMIRISYQLLRQSNYDMAAYYTRIMARRIGLGTNKFMTSGSGSSEPGGVLTRASSAFTAASATALKWQEIIDLYAAVRRTWAMNGAWMFSRATMGKIMQMVDPSGQPVLTSSIALRSPDMILGRPVVINDHMDAIATGKKPILFGDFSNYWLVRENTIDVQVLHERYADNLQVGIHACQQVGGDLANTAAKPLQCITMA